MKYEYTIFIGTYTKGNSKGIYKINIDVQTGKFINKELISETINPSFLAVHPNKKKLYAVNEVADFDNKETGSVSEFGIDQQSLKLKLINIFQTGGKSPCYVNVDNKNNYVFVANYNGGNVAMFPANIDGNIQEFSDIKTHLGKSINLKRQNKPHAHSIIYDSSNDVVLACDLGIDKIMLYSIDKINNKLIRYKQPFIELPPGSGPRHICLHPNEQYFFVINELNSTVTVFKYNPDLTISKIQDISILPVDFKEENFAGDIHCSNDGKYIYATNRGQNSISVLLFEESSGKLKVIENISTQGDWPRNFAISEDNKYLVVANQKGNNIVLFEIQDNGIPKYTGEQINIDSPVNVLFY